MPFEYQDLFDLSIVQRDVHWVESATPMQSDVQNWEKDLTPADKEVVGGILKMFTQAEVLVGDYWRLVAKWFPKPEIAAMATTFSYFEAIHQKAYAHLNTTLHLDDFKAFMQDETNMNKLDLLFKNLDVIVFDEQDHQVLNLNLSYNEIVKYNPKLADKLKRVATSLAVFSAYTEGVLIFSSFAVLLSFKTKNLLKGVGKIVEYSIRDENIHSIGGINLFRKLCNDIPGLHEAVKNDIINTEKIVVELEHKFIDNVFGDYSSIATLDKNDLKEFVKYRTVLKTKELGYSSNITYNKEAISRMNWFDALSSGQQFTDFFDTKPTDYTEINYTTEQLW
jgi:ribonucleoside-diphosphate reductase beta chain